MIPKGTRPYNQYLKSPLEAPPTEAFVVRAFINRESTRPDKLFYIYGRHSYCGRRALAAINITTQTNIKPAHNHLQDEQYHLHQDKNRTEPQSIPRESSLGSQANVLHQWGCR